MKTINGDVKLVKELLGKQISFNKKSVDEVLTDVGAPDLSIHEIISMYSALCTEYDGDIISKCVDKDKYVLLHNGNVVNSVSELIPDKEVQKLITKIIADPHFIFMSLENAKHECFVKEMIESSKDKCPFITKRSFYVLKEDEDFGKTTDKIREFVVENKNNNFIHYEEYVEYAKMAFEEVSAYHATMIDDVFSDLMDTVSVICNEESQCYQNISIEELSNILVKDAKTIFNLVKEEKESIKNTNIPNIEDIDIPKVPKNEEYIQYGLFGQRVELKLVDIQGYNVIVQKKGEKKYTTLTNVIYDCIKQASTKDVADFYNLVNPVNAEKNKIKGIKDVLISKTGDVYVTFDNKDVVKITTIIKENSNPLIYAERI